MAHVILLVNAESPNRIGLRWSDGAGWFDPYHLGKVESQEFIAHVAEAREALKLMADLYLTWVDPKEQAGRERNGEALGQACLGLACCGYRLYCDLLQTESDRRPDLAKDAERWLCGLRHEGDVETLEVVVEEGDFAVPWTVVYDEDPAGRSFPIGAKDPAWEPFWGLRYRLGAGKRIDPLRRVSAPAEPRLVVVVDAEVEQGLAEEERGRLKKFYADRGVAPCRTFEEVERRLAPGQGRAHVLYWMGHADRNGLLLGGGYVTPGHLSDLLKREDRDEGEQAFPGLLFFNTCQSLTIAPAAKGMTVPLSFTDVVHARNLSGCIGTEAVTVDVFANRFGLEFLETFLFRDPPADAEDGGVGAVLQRLREVPLGLLYAAHCPARLRRHRPALAQPIQVAPDPPGSGGASRDPSVPESIKRGRQQSESGPEGPAPESALPLLPYRALEYYDEGDAALFSGRADDVMRFSQILDSAGTRVVLLHGESGVGKTSFLRAGVLPFLDSDACVGYAVRPLLAMRSTSDLVGQVAAGLFTGCQQRLGPPRPKGELVKEIDLGPLVAPYRTAAGLRAALLADAGLLAKLLTDLGELLPGAPVLVIDQAEEVFTLAQTLEPAEALANRKAALEMLRLAGEAAGNFKIIVSLRTEYYGRFVDGLRRGIRKGKGISEYLLTNLDEPRLVEAILRPTAVEKYSFHFDAGVTEGLAAQVIRFYRNRLDSVLPLAQVICAQLYERVKARQDRTIRRQDVVAVGGVAGGIRRHVERLIDRELPESRDRRKFRDLLTRLYLEQPDGTLTTGMMPIAKQEEARASVEECWHDRLAAEDMVERMARPGVQLLRISVLHQGGSREQRCVSLGHDALAMFAKECAEEQKWWARTRKWLTGVAVGSFVVLSLALLLVLYIGARAEKAEVERKAEKDKRELAEEQRDKLEQALAQTSLQPLSVTEGPLTDIEIEALTRLAGWRGKPLADRFLVEGLSSPQGRRRLGVRGPFALHATIGLNLDKRQQAEDLLLQSLKEPELPKSERIEVALALVALGGLSPASAAEVAAPLVAAIVDPKTEEGRLGDLIGALKALAARMDAGHAAEVAAPLVAAIKDTKAWRLRYLAPALVALVVRMDAGRAREACAAAAPPLVKAIADPQTQQWWMLALVAALVALAARMDANQAGQVATGVVKAMTDRKMTGGRSPSHLAAEDLIRLADALAALAARMDAGQAAQLAAPLVVAIADRKTDTWKQQAYAVAALVARMDAGPARKACADAAHPLVTALKEPDSGNDAFIPTETFNDLADAIAALTARMDAGQAAQFAIPILAAIKNDKTEPRRLTSLAHALAALVARMDAGPARKACADSVPALVAAISTAHPELPFSDAEWYVILEALRVLAGRLDAGQAAQLAAPLVVAINETRIDPERIDLTERIDLLTDALEALIVRMDAVRARKACADAARPLVAAITATDLIWRLARLHARLESLAARMDAVQAGEVAAPLLAALTDPKTEVGRGLRWNDQARALAALAARMDAGQAAKLTAPLVPAITDPKTDPRRLARLTSALAALAVRMGSEANDACRQASEALLPLMSKSPRRDQAALVLTAKRLLGRSSSYHHASVAVTAVATATDGRGLPVSLAALDLMKKPPRLSTQQLADLLKHPLCVGEIRRAVLDQLEYHYGRPFADHWDFVRFAQRHTKLDLYSPAP
jgi:hypothetical protein